MIENKETKKVSIIVPVYNAEKVLTDCVDSIIKQTYNNWELWLVDDGSKDSSGVLCDEYVKKDDRIRVVHKVNEGVSIARNTGLERANGEYVFFVDSDDYLESETVEKAMKEALKYEADVVMFGFFYHCKETGEITQNQIDKLFVGDKMEFVSDLFRETFGKELLNPPWNKFVKKSFLDLNDIKFISEFSICEDMIFTMDILDKAEKIVFLNESLYHYIYKKGDNLVNRFHSNFYDALSVYVKKTERFLAENNAVQETVTMVNSFYVNQTIAYVKKIYSGSGYDIRQKYDKMKQICNMVEFRNELSSYIPKGIKKKIVVCCIKHKWYRLLHILYSKVLCRKSC